MKKTELTIEDLASLERAVEVQCLVAEENGQWDTALKWRGLLAKLAVMSRETWEEEK